MYRFMKSSTKRRAVAARLLACLAPLAIYAVGVASAQAAVPVPMLNGTNPTSSATAPASSTTPSLFGEAEPENIVTSVVRGGALSTFAEPGPVLSSTLHRDYEIQIFLGSGCSGAPIASGEAGEFEEDGIVVTVPENAKTVLSANQVNPADSSVSEGCSNAIPYYEGDVPTEETSSGGSGQGSTEEGGGSSSDGGGSGESSISVGPATAVSSATPNAPHIHTDPGGWANSTLPTVLGNASGAESVLLYTSDNCSGSPVVKGVASQLSSGFQVPVTPNAATTFSAAAVIGRHTACSDAVTYTEDSIPPRTRITMGPGVETRKHKAVFRFKDVTEDPPGTTFSCMVEGPKKPKKHHKLKWQACSSPFHIKHLKLGPYVVKIRATDLAGNVQRKPVERRFTVIRGGGR